MPDHDADDSLRIPTRRTPPRPRWPSSFIPTLVDAISASETSSATAGPIAESDEYGQLRHGDVPVESAALWARFWAQRDGTSRDRLLETYGSLIDVVAVRLPDEIRLNWALSDLENYGLLGLLEAIEGFPQSSAPERFITYATRCIEVSILDEVEQSHWLPRTIRRRALAERVVTGGRAGERERDIAGTRGEAQQPEERSTWSSLGASDLANERMGVSHLSDDDGALCHAIARLPEHLRTTIALRLLGGLTPRQVAAVLGVSSARVNRIEAQATHALEHALDEALTS